MLPASAKLACGEPVSTQTHASSAWFSWLRRAVRKAFSTVNSRLRWPSRARQLSGRGQTVP
jgi:hypothetical protein